MISRYQRPWLLFLDGVSCKVASKISWSIWETPDGRHHGDTRAGSRLSGGDPRVSTTFLCSPLDRAPHTMGATAPQETRMTADGTSQMTTGRRTPGACWRLGSRHHRPAGAARAAHRRSDPPSEANLGRARNGRHTAVAGSSAISRRTHCVELSTSVAHRWASQPQREDHLGWPAAAHHTQGEGASTKARWQGK